VSFFDREDWRKYKPDCVCADEAPGVRLIAGEMADGRKNYYVECVTSRRRGSAIALAKLAPEERAEADMHLINFSASRAAASREWEERRLEAGARRSAETEAWWREYDAYLRTDAWHERRAKVLERDEYVCQACLVRRAVQVHHTTYRHMFAEPLFDLVAVCVACHEEITALDRQGIPKEYREAS
jgi:hypothetical protein